MVQIVKPKVEAAFESVQRSGAGGGGVSSARIAQGCQKHGVQNGSLFVSGIWDYRAQGLVWWGGLQGSTKWTYEVNPASTQHPNMVARGSKIVGIVVGTPRRGRSNSYSTKGTGFVPG